MEDLDFGMEMPTPCEHCGKIFDLTDGYRSDKWHIDITICSDCHTKEQEEIEQDEFWEMINYELGETLDYLKDKEGAWAKLTDENKALIIQLVSNTEGEFCDCNQPTPNPIDGRICDRCDKPTKIE